MLAWAQLMVASEEDVAGFREDAVEWLQRVPLGALTAGRGGAELFVNGEPLSRGAGSGPGGGRDGAGDVFATALLIEYDRSGDPWEAAAVAACAGAASVEGPGAFAVSRSRRPQRPPRGLPKRRGG